jgi:Tfp pilus assembly protein PilO
MQIRNRQQLLVIVAITGGILYGADQWLIQPLIKTWKARSTHITELRAQVQQGKSLVEREPTLRSRWQQLRHDALPANTSSAEQQFFKTIDKWAGDSGVAVAAITPQWKHDADDYMSYQCRVEAAGNIQSLTRFLYEIEKDPMALRLESMELAARDKEGKQLSLGLQLSGLVLNTPVR